MPRLARVTPTRWGGPRVSPTGRERCRPPRRRSGPRATARPGPGHQRAPGVATDCSSPCAARARRPAVRFEQDSRPRRRSLQGAGRHDDHWRESGTGSASGRRQVSEEALADTEEQNREPGNWRRTPTVGDSPTQHRSRHHTQPAPKRTKVRHDLNGRVKTGHLWAPQNRPFPAARDWS